MAASLSEVLRRKLMRSLSDSGSDIPDNDDVDERERRRLLRLRETVLRNPKPPPGPPPHLSPNPSGPGANDRSDDNEDIIPHYRKCIELSRDNKITPNNAFSLHLIKNMKKLLNGPQLSNFSLAGFALDASAKIYSFRVDRVHNETVCMSSYLGLRKKGSNETKNAPEAKDNIRERPRKVTRGKNIVMNLDRITTELNMQPEMDPTLKKISKKFNSEGTTTGAFLTTLIHYKPNYGLLLSSKAPYLFKPAPPSPTIGSDNVDITDFHDLLKNVKKCGFCPTFNNFHFRTEDSRKKGSFTIFEMFDENFNEIPEASISAEEDFTIDDQLHEKLDCDVLKDMLLLNPMGNYYLKPEFTPPVVGLQESLIISSIDSNTNPKPKSPKTKKPPKPKKAPLVINFTLNTDVSHFFNKKNTRIPTGTLKSWMLKRTTLEEDTNPITFKKLFLNPKISLNFGERHLNQDDDLDDYDYKNAHDVNNYSESFSGDRTSYNADDESESEIIVGGQGDGDQGASSYSLIDKPYTVNLADIKIPYHRFLKYVNVKHLKNLMWTWISENAINGKRVLFSALYVMLKNSVSEKIAKDITEAIVLNCLLSLVNEKYLKVESMENFGDCSISINA